MERRRIRDQELGVGPGDGVEGRVRSRKGRNYKDSQKEWDGNNISST